MTQARTRRLIIAALAAIAMLMPFWAVQACGPDFEPDVFVRLDRPDDLSAFSKGQLGILQSGYDSNEYAVAYRYLNGGKLSPEELHSYNQKTAASGVDSRDWSKMTPAEVAAAREKEAQEKAIVPSGETWLVTRAKFTSESLPAEQQEFFHTDRNDAYVFNPSYQNCPNPAFENATRTLLARAETWGEKSPWLSDWIRGQDAVFTNCTGKTPSTPASAPSGSPALLRADRAYQLAATTFYAKKYDQAIQQFEAIAQDKSSPWSKWGNYLAARATVRKAFANGKTTDSYGGELASYDATIMQEAQRRLQSLLAAPNPLPSREMIVNELNLVRIRTEPTARLQEISDAIAGPSPDPHFDQDLADLSWALIMHLPGKGTVPDRPSIYPEPPPRDAVLKSDTPPLLAWIGAWRGASATSPTSDRWKKDRATPWLVMALVQAAPSDKDTPELLADAAAVKPSSPAYDTVFYHRVRLLTTLSRSDEARSLVDQALAAPRSQAVGSYRNALLGQRMAVGRTLPEFLKYAPRTLLDQNSEGAMDAQQVSANHSWGFDQDAVDVLNRETPLELLVQAATEPSLPPELREYVVLAAWTRSIALEDAASAAKLAPQLPVPLRQAVGTSIGFPASLAILRNPGLRPYLEPGVSRLGTFSELDKFRDNWWDGDWTARYWGGAAIDHKNTPPALFLAPQQRAAAEAQHQAITRQPAAAVLIGRRVIEYAIDHADDPLVPEALALTVRATRYCKQDYNDRDNDAYKAREATNTVVSKAAFQLLHTRYPKSPWTAKTRYYY